MRYRNPILPGFYPDPSICRVGQDFYLATSSFEYFPGVPVFHSRDLVHWRQIGHCLTRPSQLPLDGCRASGGIWAPTIRYHDGIFYMTTTNVTGGGHFFVTAADPAREWSEPVWVEGAGWDASLFFDHGKAYFQWYVYPRGIHQTEIDLVTGKHLTPPQIVWNSSGGRSPEGPHLYKIGEFYYLLAAEGGTEEGHMVTVARSKSLWGPWELCPRNPILTHRSLDRPIQTTGHGDLIQAADGSWWMVFLGTRPVGYPRYHLLGRETFLAPVTWEDGWPIVGDHGTVDLEMDAELPEAHPWLETEMLRDEFDGTDIGLQWNWLRNPDLARYSLSARPGWLRLLGAESTLNDLASPTFLGRRQRHLNCRITTRMDFHPRNEQEEAGLVVLGDNDHHYEISITCQAGNRIVFVRRKIGTLQAVVAQQPLPHGQVLLRVDADEAWYTFYYSTNSDEWRELARGETRYLSSESGAAIFTGTYFGMYTTGNGQSCQTTADFDWFEYEIPEEFKG